jgi:hypothetical protein
VSAERERLLAELAQLDRKTEDAKADAGDDLFTKARERAAAGATSVPEDWGERVALEPDESFTGRWRGQAVDEEHGRPVYLLWTQDGSLAWMRTYAALAREVDTAKPNIGDRVAVFRGADYEGKSGTGFAFGLACAACSDPLPTDDDVPF